MQTYSIPDKTLITESEKSADVVMYGSRCLLGHLNMSSAALEQCVTAIFANQNIENIQRTRRLGSYTKSNAVPKFISYSSKSFNPGVILALDQIIVKNQSCK